MVEKHTRGLRRNIFLLFWAKALMTMSVINIVIVLFYIHRGVSVSEVFYLSVVWSLTMFVVEIPSSYLADRWGRKKTLILGGFFLLFYFLSLYVSYGFWQFAGGIVLLSSWFAAFSGTDEALVYDSKRELGEEDVTLRSLGILQSAPRFFKIFVPVIGALIAKDLLEMQYLTIVTIDMVAGVFGLLLLFFLTEPKHCVDVEQQESGIMIDAWRYITSNRDIVHIILNRFFAFTAVFIIWRYYQQIFVQFGVSIVVIGLVWGLVYQLVSFVTVLNIQRIFPSVPLRLRIIRLNQLCVLFSFLCMLLVYFTQWWYVTLVCFSLLAYVEYIRTPLFSEIFHKFSHSYNRATFVSLSNTIKGFVDIPLLLCAGFLVSYDIRAPFIIAFVLLVFVVFVLRFPKGIPKKFV